MTRAQFPNTDRFQGITLLGVGTLCVFMSIFMYKGAEPAAEQFNELLSCGWMLVAFLIIGTGIAKVLRGSRNDVQASSLSGEPEISPTTLQPNTINPFSSSHSDELGKGLADLAAHDWDGWEGSASSSAATKADSPNTDAEDALWREIRYGALPKDTYRILDCTEFEGDYYDIEIEGKRYRIGLATSDEYSAYRFHDEATGEQVQTEARALVAEHKGVEAAKVASFSFVAARGT